ncbi:hypothetical protein QVD17_01027 [Tagetes erecta]|uniref:Transmembrane protein n=1 Tax=Tagetes erecta TaxID=13708 RepID=A0AAD8L9U7_TARER|nr:hypothetical protein QVD17_01027 [Tagetes erecta]
MKGFGGFTWCLWSDEDDRDEDGKEMDGVVVVVDEDGLRSNPRFFIDANLNPFFSFIIITLLLICLSPISPSSSSSTQIQTQL